MTTLRELAERWKRRASLSDGKGDLAFANNKCAAELLQILDAEGDGGAVDGEVVGSLHVSRYRGCDSMVNHDFDYYGNLKDGTYNLYIHPHPARSGVVSDEMSAAVAHWLLEECGILPPIGPLRRKIQEVIDAAIKSQGESNG